jgi:hypothetical protein
MYYPGALSLYCMTCSSVPQKSLFFFLFGHKGKAKFNIVFLYPSVSFMSCCCLIANGGSKMYFLKNYCLHNMILLSATGARE